MRIWGLEVGAARSWGAWVEKAAEAVEDKWQT